MTGWAEFALAMGLFAGSHFLPRAGNLRTRLIGAIGRRVYFALYGVMSLVLLVWVIVAAGNAPYVELWPQLPWTRWIPNVALPAAILLACLGAGMPQPHTLGGGRTAVFDPSQPGFAALSRHPLLLALALWALAHLAPNGDAAHVILFGCFAVFALAAIPAFDLAARRDLGPEAARRFFAATSVLSLRPLLDPRWRHAMGPALWRRGLVAVLVWVMLLYLHAPAIGVSPFPF